MRLHGWPFTGDDVVYAGVAQSSVGRDLMVPEYPIKLGAQPFNGPAALPIEECVRNSTAIQLSSSNAVRQQ